jgi:heterotetrameric sarcosine oxidase beta subunit
MRYSIFSLARQALAGHRGWTEAWRNPEPRKNYDVVIVGGGGHGLATAYYLAKNHGITDVAVLERGWLAGGNITRNTTIIRSNYLWDESAAIYEHSLKLWEGLEAELDYDLLFSQRGVLNLAHTLQDVRDSVRRVSANRLNGVDAEWLEPREVAELCPAAQRPTFSVLMVPRLVLTPTTLFPSLTKPVTSQFWIRSTPSSSALRANAQAT